MIRGNLRLESCHAASALWLHLKLRAGTSLESGGCMRIMVSKGKARGNIMRESRDCTKDIGAGSITTFHESNRSRLQHVGEQKKRQDALWDAYISVLKPPWVVPDADQEAVKESRCKRARCSEQGILNCIWRSFMPFKRQRAY